MEIVQLTLGALGTNCYLVKREEGVLVIDPAAEPERIASKLASLGWKPDAVVLTHAHFDHMLAANDLPGDTIALGEADVPLLTDPMCNLSGLWSSPFVCKRAPQPLRDGQTFMGFEVLGTPGHTKGGICLYDWQEKTLFSGDTLFCAGFGRTDFPGGDEDELMQSLDRLFGLPGESRVLPGHGGETTIEAERNRGWGR